MTYTKPRFKIGDKVTYKDRDKLPGKHYYCYGKNQKGCVGTVVEIYRYAYARNCYILIVTTQSGNDYAMLESEFEEYDKPQNYEIY